jgi:hypothetical protein
MFDAIEKPKHKSKNVLEFSTPSIFNSTLAFEFITYLPLEACIDRVTDEQTPPPSGLWEKLFGQATVTKVYVEQPLFGVTSFVIETVKNSGRSRTRTKFQGTLEALNDGTTAVRGEIISDSILIGVILVSFWTLGAMLSSQFPQIALWGFFILVIIFIFHQRTKNTNIQRIKAILDIQE